ncbi:hypothetical protein [Streptomyces sp. NPDC020983]|uniref:hypothetical protein n=1 Tax=Streptomyces sp. NPDC020983 TaxID=3365106 RepID=UPI003796824F
MSDLNALAWLFPDDSVDLVVRFWTPEDNIKDLDRRTAGNASVWVREGWLKTTPGNVTDYDVIAAQIRADLDAFDVKSLGFDRWSSTPLTDDLESERAPLVGVGQGYKSIARAEGREAAAAPGREAGPRGRAADASARRQPGHGVDGRQPRGRDGHRGKREAGQVPRRRQDRRVPAAPPKRPRKRRTRSATGPRRGPVAFAALPLSAASGAAPFPLPPPCGGLPRRARPHPFTRTGAGAPVPDRGVPPLGGCPPPLPPAFAAYLRPGAPGGPLGRGRPNRRRRGRRAAVRSTRWEAGRTGGSPPRAPRRGGSRRGAVAARRTADVATDPEGPAPVDPAPVPAGVRRAGPWA